MYAYIKGKLAYLENGFAVIEAGGVGYKINVASNTAARLNGVSGEVILYTYFSVREDAMELYGFLTREELSTYELVISVSGVGPKVGLGILSALSPGAFVSAIVNNNPKEITKAPGVGPKLAQRIILELKDKVGKEGIESDDGFETTADNSVLTEAIEALTVLGYSQMEARSAVSGLDGTVEEIIAKALKNMKNK